MEERERKIMKVERSVMTKKGEALLKSHLDRKEEYCSIDLQLGGVGGW